MRCFAVSSQSEERSFGDGLLSATGLARRVGASIRVHKSTRGGGRDIRPFVGRSVGLGATGLGCSALWLCRVRGGDLYSYCVALVQSSVVQCHNLPRPCALQVV